LSLSDKIGEAFLFGKIFPGLLPKKENVSIPEAEPHEYCGEGH
jgi:hypothetical protein